MKPEEFSIALDIYLGLQNGEKRLAEVHYNGTDYVYESWEYEKPIPTITQLEEIYSISGIAYKENQARIENNIKILAEIEKLEQSQLRSLREMLISPNDYAKNRLIEINTQIQALRSLKIE